MKTDIKQQRTDIVEKFINIEKLINSCISQYFFKRVDANFFFLVLYDAYFSYSLRVRVFEKIVNNLSEKIRSGKSKKKLIENLHRIGKIRNYFIHVGGFEFHPSTDGRDSVVLTKTLIREEGITPDPDNLSKSLNFTELYNEYLVIESSLITELEKIYQELGGAYVE